MNEIELLKEAFIKEPSSLLLSAIADAYEDKGLPLQAVSYRIQSVAYIHGPFHSPVVDFVCDRPIGVRIWGRDENFMGPIGHFSVKPHGWRSSLDVSWSVGHHNYRFYVGEVIPERHQRLILLAGEYLLAHQENWLC